MITFAKQSSSLDKIVTEELALSRPTRCNSSECIATSWEDQFAQEFLPLATEQFPTGFVAGQDFPVGVR